MENLQRCQVNQLLEKRMGALARAQKLITNAESEGRDMTAAEARQFDELEAEAQRHQIGAEKLEARFERESGGTSERRISLAGNAGASGGRGKITLGREERMADWVASQPSRSSFDSYEAREFSFGRLIRGMVTGNWQDAELELRALGESGGGGAGGFLTPETLASGTIDRIRNQSRVLEAGAQVVPMDSDTLSIPRLATGVTPTWRNENATVSESDPIFERVTFTARTLATIVRLSYELFEDISPNASDLITNELTQALALELDRAALLGSGVAPIPLGLLNQSGVPIVTNGANGGALTWDMIVNAIATVRGNNVEPNAVIWNPRAEKSLALLKDTAGQYLQAPAFFEGITFLASSQVPINVTVGSSTDASYGFVGKWSDLLIGVRPTIGVRIVRSNERYIDSMQIGLLAYIRADVQVAHPLSFAVASGLRP